MLKKYVVYNKMPEIQIENKLYIKQYDVIKVNIQLTSLDLNKHASFMIDLECENRDIADRLYYDLTPEEYEAWGDDDNYVIDLILSKFGFQRKPE